MNDVVVSNPTSTFVANMSANVNVGIDEVVSVFVSKWEDSLFQKKEHLSTKIKTIKSELKVLTEKIEKGVNKTQYESLIPVLNLHSKVTGVSVNWEDCYNKKKNTIHIEVGLFDNDKRNSDYPVHTKLFVFKVERSDVEQHETLSKELEETNAELIEVMAQIKSVSRKERQIRGRISEMKLEQSGFSELINNPDILKLVEIK